MSSLIAALAAALLLAAQHPSMPQGMSHEEHLKQIQKDEELNKRGGESMGFDQDAVTHHFRLTPDGGSIEITVKSAKDATTIAEIRSHLQTIAGDFSRGQFGKPVQTHVEVPAGRPEMRKSRRRIAYRYEELPEGGAVRIDTKDAKAMEAIHAFLRYQTTEHRTGDPIDR